ncbi:MAG: DNA polymerase I [Clostridiales bacterium]|nr:DNA polymerase I [Clostridiales bacterium]
MEKLVLIDGNSLLNRAYYATPVFTTKDGLPTNGVFGFVKLMLKIISDKKPTYFAVAFDVHAPTFRHKMYDQYKAGRKPMPDELAVQMPILKEVLKLMQIRICELPGHEADDLIGTIAKKFNVQTYIYTGDRDSYQLVDESTNVCYTKKGVSELLELTQENFKNEIGLTPAQIIDLKALMGDKSDNIPGVAGVGEKSALTLLEKYGDVDGIYAHLDEITGALNRKLTEGKENAYFSKKLATIDTDAPFDISLSECVLRTPFPIAVKEKFSELEFKSLLTKNVFETQEENSAQPENAEIIVRETLPNAVEEAVSLVENSTASYLACQFDNDGLRLYLPQNESGVVDEYFFPLKKGLLDVGFYDYQLTPLLKSIYEGKKRVISYNVKDCMHKLAPLDIEHSAPFEDVSILKCLADGLGNSDGLEFCLQYYSLPDKNKAYGLYRLYGIFESQLRPQERKLYREIELPLIEVLFSMEQQGICVDAKALNDFSKKYNEELSELVEKIYELAGERFNVNSTQQLGKILFEKLKIGAGAKKNKDSKNYKTTAEELEKYAEHSEIVRYLLRYRKIQKINSTYIEGFKPLIKNGRVHTTYNQANTQTGRLSSVNPNLQNIPVRTQEGRELRKLFTASEGCVLIDADYSQIELRLLAHFSKCKELIEAYCKGKDIHTTTAAQVFEVPIDKVTPDMRRDAKAVNFGIIYGISAFGLANDLNISSKKAQEYINRYFETYSDVKAYMNGNVEKATKDGFVETLCGRRRVINELRSSNYNVRSFGERAAMNMPLQGSSADIIKIAMINVVKRLKEEGYKAKLVLQVHDELIIDCPEKEATKVAEILKEEMENAVQLEVPLTVEVGVGKSWYETK